MSALSEIKYLFQFLVLFFSLAVNSIFIFLVIKESPKKLGNYKYLMCYFSIISMIYTIIDVLIQPYIHSHGAAYGIFIDLRINFLESYPVIAFTFAASLTGCFAAAIYAISINFIYRFFALERQGRLRYFSKRGLIFWALIPILVAVIFIINNWYFLYPTSEVTDYLRDNLRQVFDMDPDRITYIACLYWKPDELGDLRFNWKHFTGSMTLNFFVTLPLCIITYYGSKSYGKIKELISQGESEYSRRLQMQLYKALVAQTLLPIVFLFIPVGSVMVCPFFGINAEWASPLITFLYSFYPAVDPIPIIILVDDYRNAFFNFFRRALSQNQVVSVVSFDIHSH